MVIRKEMRLSSEEFELLAFAPGEAEEADAMDRLRSAGVTRSVEPGPDGEFDESEKDLDEEDLETESERPDRSEHGDRYAEECRRAAERETARRTLLDMLSAKPLLTRGEEYDLAVRWRRHGDREAFDVLVERNTRLVIRCAWKVYRGRAVGTGVAVSDLVSEGFIGLITAVRKFDPFRGFRLTTYAYPWIMQKIMKFVSRYHLVFQLPYYIGEFLHTHRASVAAWRAGCKQDIPAEDLRMLERIHNVLEVRNEPPGELSGDGEDVFCGMCHAGSDMMWSGAWHSSDEQRDDRLELERRMARLPELERELVERAWGVGGRQKQSMSAIAREKKMDERKVKRVLERAMEMLKRTEGGWAK